MRTAESASRRYPSAVIRRDSGGQRAGRGSPGPGGSMDGPRGVGRLRRSGSRRDHGAPLGVAGHRIRDVRTPGDPAGGHPRRDAGRSAPSGRDAQPAVRPPPGLHAVPRYRRAVHGGRPGADAALVRAAIELARSSHAQLELRHIADRPIPLVPSLHKVTMVVELSGGEDAVWKRIQGNRRTQVRKARKRGLTASVHGSEALADFYRILATNLRDLGSPMHRREFFRRIMDAFGEDARIVLVRDNDARDRCRADAVPGRLGRDALGGVPALYLRPRPEPTTLLGGLLARYRPRMPGIRLRPLLARTLGPTRRSGSGARSRCSCSGTGCPATMRTATSSGGNGATRYGGVCQCRWPARSERPSGGASAMTGTGRPGPRSDGHS